MFLKACLNGARTPDQHPALPVTADALAGDSRKVHQVGAHAVHLHVKDAAGVDTFDAAATAAVLTAVRAAAPDLPVGVTTGAWAAPDPMERVAAIDAWTQLPDFASVNWHEDGADLVAAALLARGIGVEAGLWHADGAAAWVNSPHRDRCLRALVELPDELSPTDTLAEADRLLALIGAVDVPVLLHGEKTSCWPALRHARHLGLATRIGLEDTLTRPDGPPTTGNAELVALALEL